MGEATARIRINKHLESAGWRFFADGGRPANVCLEVGTPLRKAQLDGLGDDFEKSTKGFVDFLLLDEKGFPLVVLEAKSEDKHPLSAKEQARTYARSQNCRFVLLSNGNLHYFWDLERGSPHPISAFPTPESIGSFQRVRPNPRQLADEPVGDDYIVLTQRPGYASEAAWRNEAERGEFIAQHRLRFLRPYQQSAVQALQAAVGDGRDRFLFEMATGTGKTLTAAAVIKLFLQTGNACRVLFLVDRLELEDQAKRSFEQLLRRDLQTVVYKERRDDWRRAEIVVTTVQSLLAGGKYRRLFSPTDFDLVISDEAHRSIGGNARSVFDYFVGWKLGLTATPKDYLKHFDERQASDPRELERRVLLDTYRTFGCENGEPTFRYSLLDGVRDGYLVNPTVVDARTEVTTELLSEQGLAVSFVDETGEEREETFGQREFEKRFYSEATNRVLCETFLRHALRDPVSGEVGKSIVYAVSQKHAAKLTQILNEIADRLFAGRYRSDFAVQVTSQVMDAQQYTIQFANNRLRGSGNFVPEYATSKARVCVTVGMMTTGYDCTDILNLALFRPIFSATEFIQIKGRGTRRHDFRRELRDRELAAGVAEPEKTTFKLFDFFATCEYFETEFPYDEVLSLPTGGGMGDLEASPAPGVSGYEHTGGDALAGLTEAAVGPEGMKIDRMFFERFEETVRADATIAEAVEAGDWDRVAAHVRASIFGLPAEYYSLDKLRRAAGLDRRLSVREVVEKALGRISRLKSKDELLEEEFAAFLVENPPEDPRAVAGLRRYFKAYLCSDEVRRSIDRGLYTELATNASFALRDLEAVPRAYRTLVPQYIKDYVPLNRFAP